MKKRKTAERVPNDRQVKNKKKRSYENDDKIEDDAETTIVLYERWDFDKLASICELVMDPSKERLITSIFSSMLAARSTRRMVKYAPKSYKDGRLYGTGLQGVCGWIRRICSHAFYHDVDIVNCGPTLLVQIIERTLGSDACPSSSLLASYANDRQAVFHQLRREIPEMKDVPDKKLKQVFLVGLHNGNHINHFRKLGLNEDHAPIPFFVRWERQMKLVAEKLQSHKRFKKIWKEIKKLDDKPNKLGTFMSWVWQKVENQIILCLLDFFQKETRLIAGVLAFDGIMVERQEGCEHPKQLDLSILRRAEGYIERHTKYRIKLAEKSLTPTEDDWLKYRGEKAIQKINGELQKVAYLLSRHAQLKGDLKRMNDWVMAPHKTIPGVFCRTVEDTEYINRVLKSYNAFGNVPFNKIREWFSTTDNERFELLSSAKFDKSTISFQNGYLPLQSIEFVTWEEHGEQAPPITDHYFDIELDLSVALDRATPLWDNLLETQLGVRSTCCVCNRVATMITKNGSDMFPSKLYCSVCAESATDEGFDLEKAPLSVCDILEVLIGRLFFDAGKYDNWQVCPFLKGDANTGKGTIFDIITKMFPAGSVGAITATQEKSFGLEGLYKKRVVMIPDLPKDFHKLIPQSDFQSMISSECVSIARKNKTAISNNTWTIPLIGAGNHLFEGYNDNSGSISRRLVVFPFTNMIKSRDTELKKKIIGDELVTVMLRCIAQYRRTCDRFKGQDFWKYIAPSALVEEQSVVKEQTNHLANFLANGDSYYQVLYKHGAITTLEDLNKAFSNHMKYTHKRERATIGHDYFPIKAAGFTMDKLYLCKDCHKHHNVENCGEHYIDNNRYRRVVICNMLIKSK
jgi:hypothetical protein